MKGQLQRLGISYAWEREFATCTPEYYKWNQWLFIRMFERGLAYRRRSSVNWCPKDQTVLANEQVVDGGVLALRHAGRRRATSSSGSSASPRTPTSCSTRIDTLTKWPEKVLTMQRNWIGRSEGARVKFPLERRIRRRDAIEVFTTRIDTIYGATFVLLGAGASAGRAARRRVAAIRPRSASRRRRSARRIAPRA